jgi:TolA-binding protein
MTCLRGVRTFLFILLLFLIGACANPEAKSKELYELAQFEEEQHNVQHAKKLYEELLKDYPATSFASKAKERLDRLEGK